MTNTSHIELTAGQVVELVRDFANDLSASGRKDSCPYCAFRKHTDGVPALQELFEDNGGGRLDLAKSKLDLALQSGEPWAIALTLLIFGNDRDLAADIKTLEMQHLLSTLKIALPDDPLPIDLSEAAVEVLEALEVVVACFTRAAREARDQS